MRRISSDDEHKLIIHEIEVNAGDAEAIKNIVSDIEIKHVKEKEVLENIAKESEGNLEASRRQVADKNKQLDELEMKVHKTASLTPDERIEDLSKRLDQEIFKATSGYLGPRVIIKEILEWDDAPRDLRHACAQSIARMRVALDELQSDFMLPVVDLDIDDSWMNEAE